MSTNTLTHNISKAGLVYHLNPFPVGLNTIHHLFLLIHGWSCSAKDFLPLIRYLHWHSPDTVFLSPELPGNGTTKGSVCAVPTLSALAELINDLREEVTARLPISHICEVVVIGHSMGCRIALEIFSQHPAVFSGIVLVDGSYYGPSPKDYRTAMLPDPEEERKVISEVFEDMFSSNTPEEFRKSCLANIGKVELDYVDQLRKEYIAWDGLKMELVVVGLGREKGHRKVLIVQGTDGHGSERHGLNAGDETDWMKFVRERLKDKQYQGYVVEASGHWPHVDRANEVANVIAKWRQGLREV